MAEFYSARGWEIPPLPWTNLSPPFSGRERKGNRRGPAYAYNVKALREQEMQIARQAEQSYERFAATWRPRPPRDRVRGRLKPARPE